MSSSAQPLTTALQALVADLERVIGDQQRQAEQMENTATGGTGQRADVKDWGQWGKAHATRRVAERLAEVVQECLASAHNAAGDRTETPSLSYHSAFEVLQDLIAEETNSVLREALVRGLGREEGGIQFLQRLAQKDESYAVRRGAVEALANKGDAYPVLCEIATENAYDPLARCKAVEVLGMKPGSRQVLTGLLRTEKAETIREAVVKALAHQDMPTEFFMELLRDPSEWVRLAALRAIAESSVTVGVYQDLAVHDRSRAVRLAALDLAIEREAPLSFLQKMANEDKDESMRLKAKQALARKQTAAPARRRGFWPFSPRK